MKDIKKTLIIAGMIIAASLLFVYSQAHTNIETKQQSVESQHISWKVFQEKAQDKNTVVIDIRTADEYNAGKLFQNAVVDFDFYQRNSFEEKVSKLDKNKTYLIYCRSGNRTGNALPIFEKYGLKAFDLDGGHNATPIGSLK